MHHARVAKAPARRNRPIGLFSSVREDHVFRINTLNGPATTLALMEAASAAGITVQSLSVQSTTLDDVFVHYTGRALRDALQDVNPMDRQGFMVRRQ